MARKSATAKPRWRAKLEKETPVKVEPIAPKMQRQWGTGTIVIPRALDVDELVRAVRKGKLTTIGRIRKQLGKKYGADTACPLCTGIFLRIVAETAEEDRVAGAKRITPYWRVVRDDGSMIEKFPGGAPAHAAKLKAEGHDFEPGRKLRVAGIRVKPAKD